MHSPLPRSVPVGCGEDPSYSDRITTRTDNAQKQLPTITKVPHRPFLLRVDQNYLGFPQAGVATWQATSSSDTIAAHRDWAFTIGWSSVCFNTITRQITFTTIFKGAINTYLPDA
ncbi:hypothetical protein KIN20_032735 [Parelaphostrongylus tenuis]|uniref:Uncharacterized protein n=1 Tax=Parelaphostrongylus tenuis TaxID=148309 RepID=A0AAD5WIB3_PARTN|nr:hypothetical protein KIN20_032735 [Parelaphostrongylus tenuis]